MQANSETMTISQRSSTNILGAINKPDSTNAMKENPKTSSIPRTAGIYRYL